MTKRSPPKPAAAGGRIAVHVVEPTRLLTGGEPRKEAFDRIYGMARFSPHGESFTILGGEPPLFLKCRWIRSWKERDWLTQSGRLVNEVRNLERLRRAGIPVPDTLVWGVDRRFGIAVRTFLVLRVVENCLNLEELLVRTGPGDSEREEALTAAGALARRLHEVQLYHRDLTARNVLFQRRDEGLRALLIDCPRAVFSRVAFRRAALRRADVLRLARSAVRYGATDAELDLLLDATGIPAPDEVAVRVRRRVQEGRNRSWRTRVWVMTGS